MYVDCFFQVLGVYALIFMIILPVCVVREFIAVFNKAFHSIFQ
jgi:hypothetical protein